MKYTCRKCGWSDPCFIDFGDAPAPEYCPCDGERVVWHKVTEPAALPKLTVEELERRGIEWPEWATCAVATIGEEAYFCKNNSMCCIGDFWDGAKESCGIPGQWDATDWKNSKIMRPEKVKQPPDWLKLGAWAAAGKFVGKVDWINRDASECRITCGESRFAKTGEVKLVTWRAWTLADIVPMLPLTVRETVNDSTHHAVICHASEKWAWLGSATTGIEYSVILKEFEQLSGLPCGVPQVDGADLEG